MWRCPHCGTPQAETARCWVCRRSSTSCGTCRHFRRSVATQLGSPLGFCGLDRQRRPLAGDEIRACWEARPAAEEAAHAATLPGTGSDQATERAGHLDFIEVGPAPRAASASTTEVTPIADVAPDAAPSVVPPPAVPGWSLWGETEA